MAKPRPKKRIPRVVISWMCEHCGWMNDNNPGPCRKCKKESK